MNDLTMGLDTQSSRPLYEQIYEYIKREIQSGGLPCHERLPSTRKLARHLDVSRSTVNLAYEQLLSEGYVETKPNRGYFVSELEGLYFLADMEKKKTAEKTEESQEYDYDFSISGVEMNSFPHNTWRKLSKGVLLDGNENLFLLGETQGEIELRKTIASYLHQARGVNCNPEQIVIGAGNDYLLMLLNVLFGEKKICAFENLTYKKAADILRLLGNKVLPVKMDLYGMEMEALEKSCASVAYVMPSHQFPLGYVMPVKRRMQLLSWAAAKEERYIIEDDYDSEFRYKGKPIPALQGYDTRDKVIYIGTFSKSIAPAIRISFMVLPYPLLDEYRQRGSRFSSTVSRIDQRILTEFIGGGYYERHLNKMRSIYRSHRDALLEALRPLQDICDVSGENAGTHILVKMKNGMAEQAAVDAARREKIKVYGLSAYAIDALDDSATVLLGYAGMEAEDICLAVQRLTRCWRM